MFFFQFDHKKYRIIQHITAPIFASSWKCYPGPLPIMSFVKVCNMWNCQQTIKKASHTRLQAQLGRLIKSYGSWCLCWSSQKVITNQVCYDKNKIIIIIIVVNMLNSVLLLQRETCGICSYDISVTVMTLEPWTVESLTVPHTLGNNGWKFDKKANIKMHLYFFNMGMLKMQKRKYFKIMPRCSLNALAFYVTKCYFCGFTLLNSCGEKMQLYLFLLGMMIHPP